MPFNLLSTFSNTRYSLTSLLRMTGVFLLLAIAGCSSTPQESTNYSVNWQNHQNQLEQLNAYKVTGKIGYKDPDNRQSLSFIMKHSGQYNELKLLTFLGKTVLTVSMTPTGAMITDANGQVQTASEANQLIQRLTGLSIPVSQLPDWLKGLPTQADHVEFNTSDTVASLTKVINNKDWTLNYVSYQSVQWQQSSLPLPLSLLLQQQDTQIKILITQWVL